MAFHKSNLGNFGKRLPSDLDGYVPEAGDHLCNFHFEETPRNWPQFVARAVEETERALAALDEWRGSRL